MPLTFNNVSVLSANSSSEFFGEQFRYRSLLELSIEGNFVDLSSNTHVEIHNAITAYETNAFGTSEPFYNDITINSINFGRGYVRNFSTSPDGPDVGIKKYTINITIPVDSDDANFGILSSSDFNGLNLAADNNLKYIQSFSESSSFTKGEGIKDSYSQNISITIVPEQRTQSKTFAETFVKKFLNNNNLATLLQGSVAYNKGENIRKRHDQTYDEYAGTFSVNSNWVFYPRNIDGNGDNNVIVIRNVSVNYDSQGVITVTEDGDCTSNKNADDTIRSNEAMQKANELLGNAFDRLKTGYIDESKHNPLIDQPLSKNSTSIPFQGKATYSITFTNSKEVIANTGYWSYNIVVNQTQGGDFIGNESGEITGKGELLTNKQKYNTALVYWNSNIKNNIKSRVQAYIIGTISEISTSQVHSEIDGKISYNYSLSNNKSLTVTEPITKTVTSITEDYNRNLFSTFNIIGKKEIAQIQSNRLQNNIQVNVVMNGKFTTSLSTYINEAKGIAFSYKQGQLSDVNYSYSPSNREFSLNATYFYMP